MSMSCKGCQDRYVGCHSKCDKYIDYKNKNDKLKKIKIKLHTEQEMMYDVKKTRRKAIRSGV